MAIMDNQLLSQQHFLFGSLSDAKQDMADQEKFLRGNFCGQVCVDTDDYLKLTNETDCSDRFLYLYGDIDDVRDLVNSRNHGKVFVIQEFTSHVQELDRCTIVRLGQVPLNVHNAGIYFRQFFDPSLDIFAAIAREHEMQKLTESDKPSFAFRSGIYMTPIKKVDDNLHFRLLRCSSNFTGPTDNFRSTDHFVVGQLNRICESFFSRKTELNHVLAQVYHNVIEETDSKTKERKARIKEHSDKTKDMQASGVMAFCTFYQDYQNGSFTDPALSDIQIGDDFDCTFKGRSVLTRLRFRLKGGVTDDSMVKQFEVPLYPNSVFIVPLSTNRFYTHEIAPSILPITKLPTRMGYVVRCSKTEAVFGCSGTEKTRKTHLVRDGKLEELKEQTPEGVERLKALYREENRSHEIICYGDFDFSLNRGDYTEPIF